VAVCSGKDRTQEPSLVRGVLTDSQAVAVGETGTRFDQAPLQVETVQRMLQKTARGMGARGLRLAFEDPDGPNAITVKNGLAGPAKNDWVCPGGIEQGSQRAWGSPLWVDGGNEDAGERRRGEGLARGKQRFGASSPGRRSSSAHFLAWFKSG
jgi:hypothetical protein